MEEYGLDVLGVKSAELSMPPDEAAAIQTASTKRVWAFWLPGLAMVVVTVLMAFGSDSKGIAWLGGLAAAALFGWGAVVLLDAKHDVATGRLLRATGAMYLIDKPSSNDWGPRRDCYLMVGEDKVSIDEYVADLVRPHASIVDHAKSYATDEDVRIFEGAVDYGPASRTAIRIWAREGQLIWQHPTISLPGLLSEDGQWRWNGREWTANERPRS